MTPSAKSNRVEWAVLQNPGGFGPPRVVKGPFPSREEAEAYAVALRITRDRGNHEHFMETSGIVVDESLWVGWREVTSWTSAASEES